MVCFLALVWNLVDSSRICQMSTKLKLEQLNVETRHFGLQICKFVILPFMIAPWHQKKLKNVANYLSVLNWRESFLRVLKLQKNMMFLKVDLIANQIKMVSIVIVFQPFSKQTRELWLLEQMRDACTILTGAISEWLSVVVMTMVRHGEIESWFLILVTTKMPRIQMHHLQWISIWLWYKIQKPRESLPFTICS